MKYRLKKWQIEVTGADGWLTSYTILAVEGLDARLIAYALDAGFDTGLTMTINDIEWARENTRILEVSSE